MAAVRRLAGEGRSSRTGSCPKAIASPLRRPGPWQTHPAKGERRSAVRAARPAARTAFAFLQLHACTLDVTPARLGLLHRGDPADPLVARQWSDVSQAARASGDASSAARRSGGIECSALADSRLPLTQRMIATRFDNPRRLRRARRAGDPGSRPCSSGAMRRGLPPARHDSGANYAWRVRRAGDRCSPPPAQPLVSIRSTRWKPRGRLPPRCARLPPYSTRSAHFRISLRWPA
jgi:hypothetical protein